MKKIATYALAVCLSLALCRDAADTAPAPITLAVSPAAIAPITQVLGGAPAPSSIIFNITTNRANTSWQVVVPYFMRASAASGRTPAVTTVTVLPQTTTGTRTGTIRFVSSVNTVSVPVQLVVTATAPPPPPTAGCPGALLDDAGGDLLDGGGGVLTCP